MATGPIFKNSIDQFPQEILAGIGEIVARWGYLHHQLGVLVREICGIRKDASRILTIGPELAVVCNMLVSLTDDSNYWVKDESIRKDLCKLVDDIRKKSKNRNNYAHGIFGLGEQPGTYVRILLRSSKHRIRPDEEVITADSLKAISDEAHALWIRAQDLTIRWKKQPTLLKKRS